MYLGSEDQPLDPLIAASEGEARCPAFRGLAYVVFEALELASFGNRVPALTFEVVADDGVSLGALVDETVSDATVTADLTGFAGVLVEDDLASCLSTLADVLPLALDASGEGLRLRLADTATELLLLEPPATAVEDDAFAPSGGMVRRRSPAAAQPAAVLRYLDVARDFQPGTQHASGRAAPGQPDMLELPAALESAEARRLVERMAQRRESARERVAWRSCTLDSAVAPGTLVRLPDRSGTWRVETWEWRESGVELELARVDTLDLEPPPAPSTNFPAPADLPPAQTRLVALELPWDPAAQTGQASQAVAFVGATGASWSGAALYADGRDGELRPLGPAARARSVIGRLEMPLAPANPLLLDRTSLAIVALSDPDAVLAPASLDQLAMGANLALIGEELVQFAQVEPLGSGRWRLAHFLRGLGGTEAAIASHVEAEAFALIDARGTPLPSLVEGEDTVLALGRGDAAPTSSPLHLAGIARRPLAPVHGRSRRRADGSLDLRWTRRARGRWRWSDGVDVPLIEEAERYLVTCEGAGSTLRSWETQAPALELSPSQAAELESLGPCTLQVRQQGTHALSLPLPLARLP
uniref:phage tail protein n=1 Tax=Novosphingobium chloroacetimidivorans TaxID=1428314 RepID=UPI0035E460E8